MPHRIHRAKSYPFPSPSHSFLFENGTARPLDGAGFDRAGRHPVLAAGSNQSPEQLSRKFDGMTGVSIPAERGMLAGFDVVYAAHLARYGSVPATFQASPGTRVAVFVLWLDDAQLTRMHETEANYTYDLLDGIELALDGGVTLPRAYAYSSKVGCLRHGGAPVALAEIAAEGRVFRALRQPEMQAAVRDRLAPGAELDPFILHAIEDASEHRARCDALMADALPLSYARRTLLTL